MGRVCEAVLPAHAHVAGSCPLTMGAAHADTKPVVGRLPDCEAWKERSSLSGEGHLLGVLPVLSSLLQVAGSRVAGRLVGSETNVACDPADLTEQGRHLGGFKEKFVNDCSNADVGGDGAVLVDSLGMLVSNSADCMFWCGMESLGGGESEAVKRAGG